MTRVRAGAAKSLRDVMAGNHIVNHLPQDFLAGLTGAVAGAPQAMGFALIAGVSPLYGLYTAVVSTIIAAFTGSSVLMTVGPTNALSLVVASTLVGVAGAGRVDVVWTGTPVSERPRPPQAGRPPVVAWAQTRPSTSRASRCSTCSTPTRTRPA